MSLEAQFTPGFLRRARAVAYLWRMTRFKQNDFTSLRRFDLQDAGGGGFEVSEDQRSLCRFATVEEAYGFMLANNGRVRLAWSRTLVHGQTAPYDFAAQRGADYAGRIMKRVGGDRIANWQSYPGAFNPATGRLGGTMGVHDTKEAAVAWIELTFTQTMSGRFETLG